MRKNKIALRLSLYFTLILLVFALIIGTIFYVLFKNHTVELHKTDLESRALAISQNMSEVMRNGTSTSGGHGRGMGMGMGMMHNGFVTYLETATEILGNDIWVVDKDRNLLTGSGHGHSMMNNVYEYSDLPENTDYLVEEAMNGKVVFSEGFSTMLLEPTLTVGAPIRSGSEVIGVVMLHSPVHGTNDAIFEGWRILFISIAIALILSILLSFWLSKTFTDPIVSKEAMDALRLEDARREFVANISHELKTPVTVIRGSLEALVDDVVTDPEQVKQYHSQLLNETVFLQRLVGDLLDLSKLQNMEFSIEKERISVNTILSDVLRSVSTVAKEKDIKINVQQDNENDVFYGDYGRLRQMFIVIMDNAIKFSDKGGHIDVIKDGDTITVRDYGVGIAEAEIPYIFDRFHKSRSEKNKTGTGLGLAVAKQIAVRHNIDLTVESIEGETTSFIFKFPETCY